MVSIITALYKSERYLKQYLEHVQSFADFLTKQNFAFEIVVVITQASQKEKELLSKFEKESWFKVYEFNTRGLYAAWNFGVSKAKGDLLGPWNADDVRFPKSVIEAQRLAESGADVVYFPFLLKRYVSLGFFDLPVVTRKVEGSVLEFEKRKFETTMTAGPHFMFTRKVYEKVGGFDEQFKIAGDFDWCARAANLGANFKLAKEFSGVFRVDGHGLSAGANQTLQAENNIVYKRQKANEKVTLGLEAFEGKYRLNERLFSSNWFPII